MNQELVSRDVFFTSGIDVTPLLSFCFFLNKDKKITPSFLFFVFYCSFFVFYRVPGKSRNLPPLSEA